MNGPPKKNESPGGVPRGLGSGTVTFTEERHVTFDYAAIDEALGLTEPSELAPHMTPRDVQTWQVRRAALLAILNLETRSFNEIALELGVHRNSISKIYTELCARLGFEPLFRRVETRMKNADAARRRWQKERAA